MESGRHGGFKKKNSKYKNPKPNTAGGFFKGVALSVGSQGQRCT